MTASNSPKAASELIHRRHELPKHDDDTINFDTLNQDYLVKEENKDAVKKFIQAKLDILNQDGIPAFVEYELTGLVNASRELRLIFGVKAPNKFDELVALRNQFRHEKRVDEKNLIKFLNHYKRNKPAINAYIQELIQKLT
mgnify:CR=1 FL=1|tara:strand:+ start:199 stop:621 length:423 start_codon:yes stop_codon:yes gene_type:complete